MGDPKKIKKKYSTPKHPWERARMEEESVIFREYGLKNKKDIWKMSSMLRKYTGNAKKLIASRTKQSEIETAQLLLKLQRLGLIQEGARPEDILSLTIKDFMERRLQSIVFKKGLARSMKQARQFIVHQHIIVGDKKITVPNYLVLKEEEALVSFLENSALNDPNHPERSNKKPEEKAESKEELKENIKDSETENTDAKTEEEAKE